MAEFEHVPFTRPKQSLICAIQFDAEISVVGFSLAHDTSTIYGLSLQDTDRPNRFEIQTCLLINSGDKTFRAFGSKAESEFKELVSKGRQSDCLFFKGFGGIDIFDDYFGMQVLDETGKTYSAIDMFAMMIRYLKGKFELCLSDTVQLTTDDIGWVLTLPSGSSLLFQKLMRHAAIKAGIQEELLLVITTTDAAAILFADPSFSYPVMRRTWDRPAIGTQFLTVIAGDIYVDTVVYEVKEETKVKEISSLKKGPWGITMVVGKFEQLLTEILGQSFYESYKHEMQEDWIDFMEMFKQKIMRSFNQDTVNIRLPCSLSDLLMKRTGQRLEETIANSPYSRELNYSKNTSLLRIPFSVFKSLFEESVNKIISQSLSFMTKFDVGAIFVTGKLADVDIVRDKIISSFPKTVVVFAEEMKTILHGSIIAANKIKKKLLSLLPKTPICVTSIDFGTAYSGWACSYQYEFEESPTKAYVPYWESDSIKTEKTPTHVLIRKDRMTVEAFGYDAIIQYHDLPKKEQQTFYYFRNFKMALFKKLGEKLDRHITLEDEVGRQLPAMDVFAASIKFLKANFLEESSQEFVGSLDEDNIQWVLTVPAIWSDAAKQFMREAAIKAGIKGRRLRLALEPEAASIYCRYIPVEAGSDSKASVFSSLNTGTKYMILDAGGGTVDITIHEVISKTKVKEIYPASGGNWGGMTVNNAFENLIKSFVGEDVYTAFCIEEIEDHHEILEDFEKKKRKISPQKNRYVRMNFPVSLKEKYNELRRRSLEKDILSSEVSPSVKLNKNKIEFTADIIKSLFKEPIDKIIFHIQDLLKNVNVDAILMVGGFSDSPMLQFAVRERFPSKKIVIPRDAVTAVLRGALIFGHRPWQITERVLKYTYGIRVLRPFEKGKHPESKRISTDKGDRCMDIFDIHVQKNQRVKVGESQTENSYTPANKSQKKITFEVFASQLENPKFTDENCTYIGKLTVDLTGHDSDLKRSVKVALTFSDTEIVVEG